MPLRGLDHSVDDRCDRFGGVNEACGFTEPHSSLIWVAVGEGLQVAGAFNTRLQREFGLASMPAVNEAVALYASCEFLRPRQTTNDVGNVGADRRIAG